MIGENLSEHAKKLKELLDENSNELDIDFDEILTDYGVDVRQLEKEMLDYHPKLELGYVKILSESITPKYNYESDSGFDLYSIQEVSIPKFGRVLVSTGLSFNIKDGYEIQVRSKSGLALNQGLIVLNSPGTVDNGYTGEVQVIIFNTNDYSVTIEKGTKIAQAVLCPVVNGKWVDLVEKRSIQDKDRGNNGFGSTGLV